MSSLARDPFLAVRTALYLITFLFVIFVPSATLIFLVVGAVLIIAQLCTYFSGRGFIGLDSAFSAGFIMIIALEGVTASSTYVAELGDSGFGTCWV